MKLKTLKNLKHFGTFAEKGNEYVEIEELKAEAVKWVKNCCGECRTDNETCEGCGRFIDFFNITEENLKEKGK